MDVTTFAMLRHYNHKVRSLTTLDRDCSQLRKVDVVTLLA